MNRARVAGEYLCVPCVLKVGGSNPSNPHSCLPTLFYWRLEACLRGGSVYVARQVRHERRDLEGHFLPGGIWRCWPGLHQSDAIAVGIKLHPRAQGQHREPVFVARLQWWPSLHQLRCIGHLITEPRAGVPKRNNCRRQRVARNSQGWSARQAARASISTSKRRFLVSSVLGCYLAMSGYEALQAGERRVVPVLSLGKSKG